LFQTNQQVAGAKARPHGLDASSETDNRPAPGEGSRDKPRRWHRLVARCQPPREPWSSGRHALYLQAETGRTVQVETFDSTQ